MENRRPFPVISQSGTCTLGQAKLYSVKCVCFSPIGGEARAPRNFRHVVIRDVRDPITTALKLIRALRHTSLSGEIFFTYEPRTMTTDQVLIVQGLPQYYA